LLVRIRNNEDREAWQQFVDLYAPIIFQLARRRGLQDADAADVTQEVFRSVAGAVKTLEYDSQRGAFRGWLYTVTRNKLNDFQSSRRRRDQGIGDTANQMLLQEKAAPDEEADVWNREFQQRLFSWAAEQIRRECKDSTWRAFWLMVVEGKSGAEAAEALGMTVGAVYVAKSRVLARVKKQIDELDGE
jgi:RNA polymerase sigma-70 factor (ECF subfamily)